MTNIFLFILGISVSIGLIVMVLLLLSPFLNKRYAAKWKYLIWIFLALRLLIPFSVWNGQFVLDLLREEKTQTVSKPEEKYTDHPTGAAVPYRRIVVEIPEQMTTPIHVQSEESNAGFSILDVVAFVWMMGSLIFMSVHFASYFHYKRQVMKQGKIIEDVVVLSHMSELKRELHIRRSIRVIEYCEAESPMVIGFLRPVLVLPKEQYSFEELFFILKHELVHLKRGDTYLKLLFVTANAVHWFNPLIWIMQKEAVIDMELSCDERVTQGTSYAVRKAYTETLLSMLHKRCARKAALSTQFYGGTKIMKKRFKNILRKNRKRNGIPILACAVVLTIGFGTLVGCSVAKEDAGKGNIIKQDTNFGLSQPEKEDFQLEQILDDDSSVENQAPENTTLLTFSKEGEQEQKQATLATGDGYSIYLPDHEWQKSDSDTWTATANEQVRLWVTHFQGESTDSVSQKFENDGYTTEEDGHKWKQDGDVISYAILKSFENDVWGIQYSYPVDFEEGLGRELPVIAATFARSIETDNEKSEDPGDKDREEIRGIVDEFATAYFQDNVEAMQKLLASTYDGEIGRYESTGSISDMTVKGLSDVDDKIIKSGNCIVSLEFRDSNYKDMFLYLTVGLVKQEDNWKIQSYGVEG